MEILGWIVVVVLGLLIISTIIIMCMVAICIFTKKYNKNLSRKKKIKGLKMFFAAILIFTLLVEVLWKLVEGLYDLQTYKRIREEERIHNEEIMSQYSKLIEKLPFHNEITDQEQAIWEDLVYEFLLYSKSEGISDFDELRNSYQDEIFELQKIPYIKIDAIVKYVNSFYGTEILSSTNETLEEVEEKILPLEERFNTDIEVLKNRFWLRASECNIKSSDESLYQAGRSADDVFKVLINKPDFSVKEAIFYGSMAVAFYLVSVEYDRGNIDLPFVFYSIAEIYIYLEKKVDFGEDNVMYLHCLLMAEVFLALAEKEYRKISKDDDIHEDLSFFSCYYAEIVYKFIIEYEKEDMEFISICKQRASQYMESDYSEKYTGCRNSCNDILEGLESLEKK